MAFSEKGRGKGGIMEFNVIVDLEMIYIRLITLFA